MFNFFSVSVIQFTDALVFLFKTYNNKADMILLPKNIFYEKGLLLLMAHIIILYSTHV